MTACGIREYLSSQRIVARLDEITFPDANRFCALLLATIREADTYNLEKLQSVFPEIVAELQKRYNAPGGALDDVELDLVLSLYSNPEDES